MFEKNTHTLKCVHNFCNLLFALDIALVRGPSPDRVNGAFLWVSGVSGRFNPSVPTMIKESMLVMESLTELLYRELFGVACTTAEKYFSCSKLEVVSPPDVPIDKKANVCIHNLIELHSQSNRTPFSTEANFTLFTMTNKYF